MPARDVDRNLTRICNCTRDNRRECVLRALPQRSILRRQIRPYPLGKLAQHRADDICKIERLRHHCSFSGGELPSTDQRVTESAASYLYFPTCKSPAAMPNTCASQAPLPRPSRASRAANVRGELASSLNFVALHAATCRATFVSAGRLFAAVRKSSLIA